MANSILRISKPTSTISVVIDISVNCARIKPNNARSSSMMIFLMLSRALAGSSCCVFARNLFHSLAMKNVASKEKRAPVPAPGSQPISLGTKPRVVWMRFVSVVPMLLPMFSIFDRIVSCCPSSKSLNKEIILSYKGRILLWKKSCISLIILSRCSGSTFDK